MLKSGTLRLAVSAKNARSEKPGNGTLYKPTWSYSDVPWLKMFAFAAHLALVKGQIAERESAHFMGWPIAAARFPMMAP